MAFAAIGGLLIGILLTVFGGGGSVLATPWLIYVVGVFDTHVAIGTSAAAVTVNAIHGLMIQGRAGIVKWPCAIAFGLAGLIGVMFGTELAKQIVGNTLTKWFALAMIAIAAMKALLSNREDDPTIRRTRAMFWKIEHMVG